MVQGYDVKPPRRSYTKMPINTSFARQRQLDKAVWEALTSLTLEDSLSMSPEQDKELEQLGEDWSKPLLTAADREGLSLRLLRLIAAVKKERPPVSPELKAVS